MTAAYIEKSVNGFGEDRWRYYTVREDGTLDRSVHVWPSAAAARAAATKEHYDVREGVPRQTSSRRTS